MLMRFADKLVLLYLACHLSDTIAAPQGANIITPVGVEISGQGTSHMVVNQNTNQAIINWKSFNVGNGESVQFNTPGANAATLNRITSGDPTQILGKVDSNGQLWLINPNGILFGNNSQINVAGLLASTLNITDKDFLAGNYKFHQDGPALSKIVNQGHITANGGYVALLAPQIENQGFIEAKLGTVALGAGTKATLELQGNKFLRFAIEDGAEVSMYDENGKAIAALNQSGKIAADGGQVFLVAKSINSILNQSINVGGIVQADTVEAQSGKIVLLAKGNTIVENASLSAQGLNAGEVGGKVEVIGQNVGLVNTNVVASGAAGGGEIRIGRDDTDPNAFEANMTAIMPSVVLKAEATQTGNGGFIETSGYFLNVLSTHISTHAVNGKTGTWLLDPFDVTISNASTSSGSFSSGVFTPTATSNVNVADLETALGSTDVTITTGSSGTQAGDITVANVITSISPNVLTLNAAGAVTINAAMNLGGDLNITAAGGDITQSAALVVGGTSNFSAGSHNITLTHASNDFGSQAVNLSGGTIQITDANTTGLVLGDVNSTDLTAIASGTITQTGTITNTGTMAIQSGAAATLSQSGGNYGTITTTGGGVGGLFSITNIDNDLTLGAISSAGLTITAGNVTQNDVITTTGEAVTINASGDFSQSADGSIVAGSGSTWGDITIHAGTNAGIVGAGAVTLAGLIEGNAVVIDNGVNSTSDLTQSGTLISHDTGITGISLVNDGAGDVVQTSAGSMTLTFADPPTTDIGIALTASHGNIQQSGSLDAKQSLVTLKSEEGNYITQDDGAGNLGSITAGSTKLYGQNGAQATLSGNNNFGILSGFTLGDLTVNDVNTNGLVLDAITLDGNLAVTAQSISQSSGIQMTGTGKTASFIVATGGAATLDQGNDFGGNAVSVVGASSTSTGAVTINDSNVSNLVLGAISSSTLTVSALGAIAQSDTITADGDVSLTGATITTSADLDAGTHTVNLTATDAGITAGNKAINVDDGTLTAGNLNITTASGSVAEDFGLIHSSGTMTIAASDGSADGGNSVDFSQNPSNLFGTVNITNAGDVNLAAMNGYTISGINSTGDITAKTNYAVSDPVTGTLTVSGAVTTTKSGGTISLGNALTTAQYGVVIDGAGSLVAGGGITIAADSSETGLDNNGINIAGDITCGSGDIYIYANRNYGIDFYAANMNISGSISTTSGSIFLEDFGAGTITIANGANLNGGNSTPLTVQSDNGSIAQTGGTISGAAGLNVTAASAITQTSNAVMSSAANTTLSAGGKNSSTGLGIDLAGTNNSFDTVSANANASGAGIAITTTGDLSLTDINAAGDVLIKNNSGTLTFATNSAPTIVSGGNVTLVADQFNNQNGSSAIDLSSGAGKVWNFYLSNLDGNTFSGLSSGNQAIWGTSYPTAISQTGNRYIFGTTETLTLIPISNSMNLTATQGMGTTLPTPVNGTNFQASGFVNASDYDNVFTQDTASNVLGGSLSFTSTGSVTNASAGTYNINMTAPSVSATGYSFATNGPYGTIVVTALNNIAGGFGSGPQNSQNVITNPALVKSNIEDALPVLGNQGQILIPFTQAMMVSIANGVNPNFNFVICDKKDTQCDYSKFNSD
ncbi:MAG: filamentous hemagglutinin N-terminal domain-containing protein [Pseudomonadota bacterium]